MLVNVMALALEILMQTRFQVAGAEMATRLIRVFECNQ